jgi:hypothetical protein
VLGLTKSDLEWISYNYPDDLIEENFLLSPAPSPEPSPTTNLVESSWHDIPLNPKEWQIIDKISKRQRPPRLYEFLILLLQKSHYETYASFKDKSLGIFEVHEPEKVAELWQQIKNRQSHQKMTYDKFARGIRWYYKLGIMKKTNARYTFQFSPKTLKEFIIDENNNTTTRHYFLVNQEFGGISQE